MRHKQIINQLLKNKFHDHKILQEKNQEVNIKIENVDGTCHFLEWKDLIKYHAWYINPSNITFPMSVLDSLNNGIIAN